MVKLAILPSESDMVVNALLRHQYFPNVKDAGKEFPPLFDSSTFTDDCAGRLATAFKSSKSDPHSWVEFRARRFDGLVRRLGVPHPVPYSKLVSHLGDHWNMIEGLLDGQASQVRPRLHRDGRIIQMNYETPQTSLILETRRAQGRDFLVEADVSNCFPSVYSHSLDWAIRGKSEAKKSKNDKKSPAWQLDALVRDCHDGETKGLMIGPAVSNVLAELVLQRVDEALAMKGHAHVRFVDDFKCATRDRSQAERFVTDLQHALSEFRLDLNTRKTKIHDLRGGLSLDWMDEVRTLLPRKSTEVEEIRFLRASERLAVRFSGNSVLKFAVKTMRGAPTRSPSVAVADELLRIAYFHPHILPLLSEELEEIGPGPLVGRRERMGEVVLEILHRAAERRETDVVVWALWILRRNLSVAVLRDAWVTVLEMQDDLATLGVAILCPRARRGVISTVLAYDQNCNSDFEMHWLVRYELYRVGYLKAAALNSREHRWMQMLKDCGVRFSILGDLAGL